MSKINVIDLFAGPGGLGEGFSAFNVAGKSYPFKIRASVEKDDSAHKTLELRAFFRQFRETTVPPEYYEYIRNPHNLNSHQLAQFRAAMFDRYKVQSIAAREETLEKPRTLGQKESDQYINKTLTKILEKHKGEPFVVIGGPPCQAYSLVGRSRMAGVSGYRIEDDHRASLYKEYLKVLHKVSPEIFVMENVKGILSAKLDGKTIFPQLIDDLKNPSKALNKRTKAKYRIYSLVEEANRFDSEGNPVFNPQAFTIKAELYNVPQTRHRVILLGIRTDIDITQPPTLPISSNEIPIQAVIDKLPPLRSGLSKNKSENSSTWVEQVKLAGKELITQLKATGSNKYSSSIAMHLKNLQADLTRGDVRFVKSSNKGFHSSCPKALRDWYYDKNLRGFPNHETKSHMIEDLKRYLWISVFAEVESRSPKSKDFPDFLAPKHKNWKSGHHTDRFQVQVRNKPASTITCHLSKDGHKSIHYDPKQCRSLTVREAARIQTFPDNYFFEGTRTQQYIQVGNAVPPYLAYKIANIVHSLL